MEHKAPGKWEDFDIPALATACGIKPPSVHGWLNGSTQSLKAGPAIKAARFLGVSALWLAEGEGPMIPTATSMENTRECCTPDEFELLQVYRLTAPDHRKSIIAIAKSLQEQYPLPSNVHKLTPGRKSRGK